MRILSGTPGLSSDDAPVDVFRVLTPCHDIGKLTPWFQQDALQNPNVTTSAPTYGESRDHSLLGAAATWYAARKVNLSPASVIAAAGAVHRHHSNFPTAETAFLDRFAEHTRFWEKVALVHNDRDSHYCIIIGCRQ